MEQSPSWEANSSSASQEIPRILWNNSKVYYIQYKRRPPVRILSNSFLYQLDRTVGLQLGEVEIHPYRE